MHRTHNVSVTLAEFVNTSIGRRYLAAMWSGFRHILARSWN
jgi:hypothetical protein